MTLETAVLAGLIVLCGSAARGFTGFGGVLFTLPLLVLVLPVKQAVPLLAALALANGLWLAWSARPHVDWPEARRLLCGGVPGTVAGLVLFHRASDAGLRGLLGLVVAVLGLWLMLRKAEMVSNRSSVISGGWGAASGAVGGALAGLYGLSGPPAIFYLARRSLKAVSFRATLLFYITVLDVMISAGFTAGGALTERLWLLGLALLPVSILGSWCGEQLHRRTSQGLFLRLVGFALTVMGLVMAWSRLQR